MKRLAHILLLILAAQGLADPRQKIEQNPGDIEAAVKQLGGMLQGSRMGIFAEFERGRIDRPNDSIRYAATGLLSLQRMGKLSVHAPEVKSAFTYEFLTSLTDPTRLHEALALYERFPAANTEDPYWRLIRAHCARLMHLPETLELYEQVAADMSGVAPSDDLRKVWDANREAFDLPDHTRETWRKQTTFFVYDGKGQDVPGSPPTSGSPLPLIDLAGAVGTDAAAWEGALTDLPNASPRTLDQFYVQTKKYAELPWFDGRGFVDTEQLLNTHLLAEPGADLATLRQLQELGYLRSKAKAAAADDILPLFRRYPWSASAHRHLLQLAQRQVFQGQPQAAFRGFQDVLRHSVDEELRQQAQVGLWLSLAQFAETDRLVTAFESVQAESTWPWYGKVEEAAVIKAALVNDRLEPALSPTLASLKQHHVQLPPVSPGATNQTVFNIDLQRRGDRLLASSDGQLLSLDANKPGDALWHYASRVRILNGNKPAPPSPLRNPGASRVLPVIGDSQILTSWAGNGLDMRPVVAFSMATGEMMSTADSHSPQSRHRYRSTGSPLVADGNVYVTQLQQPHRSIYGHVEYRGWGEVALSCFEEDGLGHRWTRVYEVANTSMIPSFSRFKAVLPRMHEGALYVCTNDGQVMRVDARDGELEWIHFFRPMTGDGYSQPASPRALGARPIVTDDKVICMPKFTGYLFALDSATGRRIWRTPILRGHELLGVHGNNVVAVSANALYAVDLDSGQLRWGRAIAAQHADGFQLPRSQIIGSSIYCGTRNALYRFDVASGALLESRTWQMDEQVPMSFHISGNDLYVISDLPRKEEAREQQLVDYLTTVHPAAKLRDPVRPIEIDGVGTVYWQDCMLTCIKDSKVAWTRFVSNTPAYQSRFSEQNGTISLSWSSGRSVSSAVHDAKTGRLLRMHGSRAAKPIEIGDEK